MVVLQNPEKKKKPHDGKVETRKQIQKDDKVTVTKQKLTLNQELRKWYNSSKKKHLEDI